MYSDRMESSDLGLRFGVRPVDPRTTRWTLSDLAAAFEARDHTLGAFERLANLSGPDVERNAWPRAVTDFGFTATRRSALSTSLSHGQRGRISRVDGNPRDAGGPPQNCSKTFARCHSSASRLGWSSARSDKRRSGWSWKP